MERPELPMGLPEDIEDKKAAARAVRKPSQYDLL